MKVEEIFCNRCANKSKPNFYQEDEAEDIYDLGLSLPEITNYDY